MSALTAAALIVARAAGATTETSLTPERPDLAVVNSLGPVLPNETVAAFVPNFAGAVSPVTVRILDGGEPTAAAVDRPVLRQAAGVVHWLNSNTELDQLNYTLCVDGACGPPTKLNAAELWWHGSSFNVVIRAGGDGKDGRCTYGNNYSGEYSFRTNAGETDRDFIERVKNAVGVG